MIRSWFFLWCPVIVKSIFTVPYSNHWIFCKIFIMIWNNVWRFAFSTTMNLNLVQCISWWIFEELFDVQIAHFESRTENYWMSFLYRVILLNGWLLEHKFLLNNWFYMHSVLFEAYSRMIWRYLDHRLSDLSDKWNGCQPNADFTCVQFLLGFSYWNVICSINWWLFRLYDVWITQRSQGNQLPLS